MKQLIILLAVFLASHSVFAQQKTNEKTDHKMHSMSGKMKDCVMMENGKMMMMKAGTSMAMTQDMTMTNGTMVMMDGTVKHKDGTTAMLKDGQCIYMNGKMGSMKMADMKKDNRQR